MTIHEQENHLFERWRSRRPDIVRDGIIDESSFVASRPRILLVLKEPNGPVNDDRDLRQFVRDGGRSQTWDNVARWVAGIERLPSDTPWREVAQLSPGERRRLLRRIAAINLKKSPGGGVAERESIVSVARADQDLLREQIGLYDADLTICCGAPVGDLVEELLLASSPEKWAPTSRGVYFKRKNETAFVIDYAHPQVRTWSHLLFYGLVDAVRELRHSSG